SEAREVVEAAPGDRAEDEAVEIVDDLPDEGPEFVEDDGADEADPTDAPELLPIPEASPEAVEPAEPREASEGVDPKDCQHPVTVAVVDRGAKGIRYEDLHNGTHRIAGTGVLVSICADCGMAVGRKDEYVEKCAYAADGSGMKCRWCGHVQGDDGRHIHEFTGAYREFTGDLLETFPASDAPELYHVCRFQKTRARKCAKCDTYEDAQDVPGEYIEQREYHVWNAVGQCAVCGYERTCRHDGEFFENTWTEDERFTFVNASVHEYAAVRYAQRCCARCGEPIDNVEVKRVSEQQPHRYVDGVCADCGYVNVCDHADMSYTYGYDAGSVTFACVNALTHEVTEGVYITEERCPDCGFALTGVKLALGAGQRALLPHRFDGDGVCMDCGYTAPAAEVSCDHPEAYRVALDRDDVDALKRACRYAVDEAMSTETRHVLRVEYDPSWVCGLCGHREDLSGQAEVITVSEPHRFHKGYCVTGNCGYRCAHGQVDGQYAIGAPFYEYDDETGHYETTPTVSTGTCALCGEYVKNHVVDKVRGRKEAHVMQDGVCKKCGYACPHPAGDIVQLLPAERTVYAGYDAQTHTVREERVTETICVACGYTLFEEVEVLGEYAMPHRFVDGVCELCGAGTDSGASAEAGEVYTDLPAGASLNGVAVEDGLDIVTACVRVGESLQADIDRGGVKVEIEGLSKLFTDEELARLDKLTLKERLLTAQCFLGFRNAVAAKVAGDSSLLGNQARALIGSIQNRMALMDDEEREALESALRTAFPMTTFEVVPGATTEVFNIDLAVDDGDSVAHDRYSFHDTGTTWMLINIATR
ncbi:MAG: hypothetical protein IJ646_12530, partial [Clostridia bacterium]|nr:hypothetical protein [Clostridia bacterium]